MEKKYSFETLEDSIIIRFTKLASHEDIIDAISDIEKYYPNKKRLWDLDSFKLDLNPGLLLKISRLAEKQLLPTRAAIVASDDLNFGFSRMYQVYRQQEGLTTRVFRTEEEATIWLNGPSI